MSESGPESNTWTLVHRQIHARLARNGLELREEGLLRFTRRKIRITFGRSLPHVLRFIVCFPPALVVVILARLVRPFIRIRFASLNASRLGHLALDAEMMLCESKGLQEDLAARTLDVWCVWTGVLPIANQYLLRLWKRSIIVLPEAIGQTILQANGLLPGADAHLIPYRKGRAGVVNHLQGDPHDCFYRYPPHIEIPSIDVEGSLVELERLGVPRGAKFVCLAVRDPAYLSDFRHVGLGDHDYRNAVIDDYVAAAECMASRGIYVLRMGKEVSTALECSSDLVIDYANSGLRTEMLDVFLASRCEFCVSSGNGFDALALLFRRPVLYTNLSQLDQIALNFDTRFIPRNFSSIADGRLLSASEVYGSGLHVIKSTRELAQAGVTQIPNSGQEIADAVEEFIDRRSEFRELQTRFLERVPPYLKTGRILGGICGSFLLKYPHWME